MKISEYISQQIKLGVTEFDIGIGENQTVNDASPTRVRFKIERNLEMSDVKFIKRNSLKGIYIKIFYKKITIQRSNRFNDTVDLLVPRFKLHKKERV